MPNVIYSAEPGLIIGFHGCEKAVCDAIICGKKRMKVSNNPWDWLGDGMYFWQNNYQRALHYAKHPPGKLKIKEPATASDIAANDRDNAERNSRGGPQSDSI
ncbi:MAG: hypothetical protein BGO55_14130 [Sphingobacteriales bacterium 50-39]|nr:hypothetical protein [Sphingobacteriales bacterium]OJW57429.1 MAG: hypothetical protein BGO55_14130 [Sphingobacteriales bacterium 50-39]